MERIGGKVCVRDRVSGSETAFILEVWGVESRNEKGGGSGWEAGGIVCGGGDEAWKIGAELRGACDEAMRREGVEGSLCGCGGGVLCGGERVRVEAGGLPEIAAGGVPHGGAWGVALHGGRQA